MKCEMPLLGSAQCPTDAKRGVKGINGLGQRVRLMLCEPHLADFASGRAERRILEQMRSLGLRADNVYSDEVQCANAALNAHQAICAPCMGVKTWTLAEMAGGRVVTAEDRNRVGMYSMEHACEEGADLLTALGRVMMQ